MRVRLKTTMAGPSGAAMPGEVLDLPADAAAAMVAGGYADAIAVPKVERAERAVVPAAPERRAAGKKSRR